MTPRLLLAASLAALVGAAPLAAQTPPPLPPKREVSVDLSFINKTGNTDITTTGFAQKFIARPGWRWTLTEYTGFVYGKNNGDVLAESYRAGFNAEMALSAFYGTYGSVAFERNVFSGLAARYTYSAGLSAILVDVASDKAKFEVGIARISQRAAPSDQISRFFSGRLAGEYRHNFSPVSYFNSKLELLPNLRESEDLRVNALAEVVAPISRHIGLRSSYLVQFDRLPEPGKKKTDTTLQTGLQINF